MLEEIATKTRRTLEKVFGQVHYSNFLQMYKGIPQNKACEMAKKEFNL